MPYKIGWLIPNRVYVFQPIGDVSLEEFAEASDRAIELIRSGESPVHCIGDARQVKSFPLSISEMSKASAVMNEPKLGWFLVVTNYTLLAFSAKVLSRISNVKFKAFKEPNELLLELGKLDTTLPEMPIKIELSDDATLADV